MWVQLYCDNGEAIGEAFEILVSPQGNVNVNANVGGLKEAVKNKTPELSAISASRLKVYPAATSVPVAENVSSLDAWTTITALGGSSGPSPFIVVAPSPTPTQIEQRPQEQQQPEPMLRFRSLLESKGITPIQSVMMQLVKYCAASLAIVSDAETAQELYFSASRIPQSATELVLKDKGISVAQPFVESDPAKVILLHAFRDGFPMILKVSSPASIKHEIDVISSIDDGNLAKKYLCHIEGIQFQSASTELTDMSGLPEFGKDY